MNNKKQKGCSYENKNAKAKPAYTEVLKSTFFRGIQNSKALSDVKENNSEF